MRTFLLFVYLLSVGSSLAQDLSKKIGVSFFQMTLIVFESEVEGYNVGLPESIDVGIDAKRVKIQALDNQWEQSNLVVWTKDGNYYTFDLSYADQLSEYFHVINEQNSSYKEMGKTASDNEIADPFYANTSLTKQELAYLQLSTTKLVDINKRYTYLGDERKRIDLYLDGLFVDDKYFFIKLSMYNRTEVVYNVEVVSFTIQARKKKGISATSSTPEIQDIVYKHGDGFVEIGANSSVTTVYVIDKFALDQDSELIIDIFETNGSRERSITVLERDVNNANGIRDVID